MAPSLFPLLALFLLLRNPLFIKANLHKTNRLFRSGLLSQYQPITPLNATKPSVFFEVTKPIKLPKTKPCSHLILQHDFGFTYGSPPVLANYTPPTHCPSQNFSKIVLKWQATCKGRQFDRIFGVWLGGVELLRSCTAEPTATGIVWSVEKDITRYYSLLVKNETQTFSVYLGNVVDSTYTGVYHVNVTIYFYPADNNVKSYQPDLVSGYGSKADLILPISRNLPLNDGLWFEIRNSTDTEVKEFKIPQNVYRVVLEVYVSFHENDEFWYTNLPNDYIAANHLGTPENGSFREVVVSLDGKIVGAIWPFTVIYTGGINPLWWRPITGIASFNLPSYDIEITPFLGNILDGKTHKFGFSVTNASNVWFIDANLHLWLDSKSTRTEGKLLTHYTMPLLVSLTSNFKDLNGTFLTKASRSISSTGWVKSSNGMITTYSSQDFHYSNSIVIGKDGHLQTVNQMIHFNDSVYAMMPSYFFHSMKSNKSFSFYLYGEIFDEGKETYDLVRNFTLGFNEKKSNGSGDELLISSIGNMQNGQSVSVIRNNLIVSAAVSTQQVYKYDSTKCCYLRNISSSNLKILYDKVAKKCSEMTQPYLGFGVSRLRPFPATRALLSSD